MDDYIDTFLGIGENKSVANSSNAREIAKERLVQNAKEMLAIKDEIAEINSIIDNHPDANYISDNVREELAYLKIRKSNWEERLNEITEHLGTTLNNKKSFDIYGSKKALESKKVSLNKYNEELTETIKDVEDEKAEILLRKKSKDKEVSSRAKTEEKAINLKLQSLREKQSKAKLEMQELESYTESLSDSEYTRTLTEEEILRLNPEDRAYMLDEKNLSNYSLEQQQIIKNTIDNLKAKDPNLLREIKDAAELATRIEGVNGTFAKISDNPIEASEYFDLMREYRNEVMSHLLRQKAQNQVENMFAGKNEEEIKSIAKNLPTIALDDYVKSHPEHKDIIDQVREVAQLRQDARLAVDVLTKDKKLSIALKQSIINLTEDSNNKEEAINSIEEAIDNDQIDETTRNYLDEVLQKLEKINYQRNATKVKERKDKVERETKLKEERKKEEEKKKKAEEEAKKVAESKKNESKIVPVEEPLDAEPTNVPTAETLKEDTLDDVSLDSPSIEQQSNNDNNVIISTPPKASSPTVSTSTSESLVGNALYRYNGDELNNSGKRTKRVGAKENDSLNKFYAWIESLNINYQAIIDNELNNILSTKPKVFFLTVNPVDNATKDKDMNDHVLEVVEYTDAVAKKHNESYGGVIESNGKKWLVIGVLGFNGQEQGDSYRAVKYELKKKRFQYFNANKNERFYVDPDFYTEVKEIGTGWITRQLESDTEMQLRGIQELLDSPERNPRGLKLEDLKWGIQQGGKFATVGISHRNRISTPVDIVPNLGNTFLMVEGANGKFVPVAIRPTMYTELKKGTLTDEINTLLMELTSTNHNERLEARIKLASLLYLKDSENTILIGSPSSNTLSIKKNGNIIKTFNLDDSSFNAQEYIRYVEMLNPRVNITTGVLSSPVTLRKYDEAGALMTDIAILGTSNADFSVKGVGVDGKPINTSNESIETNVDNNSGLTRTRERSFGYQGSRYRHKNGNYYTLGGELITDPRMKEQLHYTRVLSESKMNPVYSKDSYDYYIISEDRNNPIAIKKDRNSGMIVVSNKEQSLKMIDLISNKKKQENAEKAVSKIVQVGPLSTVSLEEELTNEILGESNQAATTEAVDENTENVAASNDEDINTTGTKSLAELQGDRNTDSFSDILCSEEYGDALDAIIQDKIDSGQWTNVPSDMNKLSEYLQSKGISITGIQDVESWMNMIKECK